MTDVDLKSAPDPGALRAALAEALDHAGIRYALAPVEVVASLRREVEGVRDRGLLASSLFDSYEAYWRFEAPDEVAEPRTLIVAAWPAAPVKMRFQLEGGPLEAVVPPTYVSSEGRSRCLEAVRSVLAPAGCGVGRARVPVKLLAARIGLAQYGRNNIAYVQGLGSYMDLRALCTDADLGAVGWDEPDGGGAGLEFMNECARCHACQRACPTGAIPEDGTVIDAARCLTEANENEGEWPAWVPAAGHNSLVGCSRCQQSCPVNRDYQGKELEVVAEFDRAETALLLQGLGPEQLPDDGLRAKLASLDLDEYARVLGRNLRALEAAARAGSAG